MIGTILNAIAILIGGFLGILLHRSLPLTTQVAIKGGLGILLIFIGLKMTWDNLGGGSLGGLLTQLIVLLLALTIGRIIGRFLHLQKGLNRLGKHARDKLSNASTPNSKNRWSDGFVTCSILYCLAPLSCLGSVQDGLTGNWQALGAKAIVDGMATMALAVNFGWSVLFSAVPVLAYQGTISLLAKLASPILSDPSLIMSVGAVNGLLVFCVALLILEVKSFEVGDYLPSLAVAPLLTHFLR